jgi:hypothetical protein
MAVMDLSSYTGLKAAIAKFLNRDDLVDEIPGFIVLAEAEIGRRLRRKTITKSVTIASASTPLPSDAAELRSVRLVTASRFLDKPLRIGTVESLADTRASYGASGRPIAAAPLAGNLLVAPDPDTSYAAELQYFEKLVPLSATVASNSILAESPDLYLYGALMHTALFLEHDERVSTWEKEFEKALAQLEIQREREETNASMRPVRLARVFG